MDKRWQIMLACNDYRNGMSQGFIDAAIIYPHGIKRSLELHGPEIRCTWIRGNRIRISRRVFTYATTRRWVGNWCWDAIFVDRYTARQIAATLKSRGFAMEAADKRMNRWWELLITPKPRRRIRAVKK